MCLCRREFIKPELNAQFRSLCTSAPITSWLFGDDICGQIKDLQQHNQIGIRLTQSRSRLTPMDPDRNLHQGNIKLEHVIMHEGADFMATLSVQAPVTMSLFYTREITPKLKRKTRGNINHSKGQTT